MADVKVRVTFNAEAVEQGLLKQHKKAQYEMSMQALKDCNYYCKQDQDGLISSSIMHSDLENGILRWQTPYARMQYYLDNTRTGKNEHARKMWAHEAASKHKEDWRLIYDKVFKGGR